MSAKQTFFDLQPNEPFSLQYLVAHSGIAAATDRLGEIASAPNVLKNNFIIVFIHGPKGCGKSHIAEAYCNEILLSPELSEDKIKIIDIDQTLEGDSHWAGSFVASYEKLKSAGGLMVLLSRERPENVTDNPHVRSRLLAGDILQLSYPQEEELSPILSSLLERRNMKLSERSMTYLLRRLPREPLSFDSIFARINELSLEESRPAGLGVIRELIDTNNTEN